MKPVGLTGGLAGLFAASLDILDRISTATSCSKDYPLFSTRVETKRQRLPRWGQAVALALADAVYLLQQLQDLTIRNKVASF